MRLPRLSLFAALFWATVLGVRANAACGPCTEFKGHDENHNEICAPTPGCNPEPQKKPESDAFGNNVSPVLRRGGGPRTAGGQAGAGVANIIGGLNAGASANEDGGDFDAAQMLKPDEALERLNERRERLQQRYGVQMGGKYGHVIRSATGDIEGWLKSKGEEGIDQQTFRQALGLLDTQIGLAYWEEVPGLTDEQRRAQLDRINERLEDLHHKVPRDVMEVVHKAFDDGVKAAQSVPTPPGNTSPASPGNVIPGGGLPSRPMIDDMLKTDPKNPSNLVWSARDSLSKGDRAAGLASLDKAIANGGTADAYALRGGLRLDDKDFDGAYQDAKKALELNPGDKGAMGILRSAEGRTSPGLASSPAGGGSGAGGSGSGGGAHENHQPAGFTSGGFNPGRVRDIPGMTPASTLASNQKLDEARRALNMGDVQAAIALAQRALELNPSNAAAHNFLSAVYARTGDYKRAVASANAGLALAPRDAALLNNKAFAENRAKLYRDALDTSNHAIEADARNPYSYANRAHAYGGLGDKDAMMSDINRAASMDPGFQKAAAEAAALQLPSNEDILFMFPGESSDPPAAAPAARSRSFGLVVGAGLLGGLLLALGLLSTVLAPLKDSVVSAFTKVTRRGPSVHALEEEATPEAAPAGETGLIRGQYEISRQIGAGGMGMVYEGTDRSLGRRVAIKKMREELRVNARERERFVIEAKTVASLHHPNIVDIYAIAEEGEDVYLVFEYVDGRTIHDLVQAQGRLSPADSVRVTRAMGDALTYAHAHGVIHRDMKPSNVMLTSDGRIKVMDFGIARMAKDALTRYSMTNTVVGTPPYMAPEQEQGVVRKESDVYSLAVCAYEMLTGKLPFIGIGAGMLMNKINMSYIPPSRAIAGLPEALDGVFLKAFQADPEQRYRTPQEFAAALESAFGGVAGRI